MKRYLLTTALAASLVCPVVAQAQSTGTAPLRIEQTSAESLMPWLVVGAGAVLGAVLLHGIMPEQVGNAVLGAAGGYLAMVWYNGGEIEVRKPATR